MVLSIKIPDELYERISKLNPQNPRYAMERILAKYAEAGYSAKTIVLSKDELAILQDLVGNVDSAEALVEAIRRALSVRIEGVEVALTEGQRKRLETNAKFWNQTTEEHTEKQIKQALVNALGV